MNFNLPKNDSKYHWTNHSIRKMAFYGLSPDRVKRVMRNPKRVEEGIAENTIAVMQLGTNLKKPSEVWVMYQLKTNNQKPTTQSPGKLPVSRNKSLVNNNFSKKIIISAWRYPGTSPEGKKIPVPAEILEELQKEGVVFLHQ